MHAPCLTQIAAQQKQDDHSEEAMLQMDERARPFNSSKRDFKQVVFENLCTNPLTAIVTYLLSMISALVDVLTAVQCRRLGGIQHEARAGRRPHGRVSRQGRCLARPPCLGLPNGKRGSDRHVMLAGM